MLLNACLLILMILYLFYANFSFKGRKKVPLYQKVIRTISNMDPLCHDVFFASEGGVFAGAFANNFMYRTTPMPR